LKKCEKDVNESSQLHLKPVMNFLNVDGRVDFASFLHERILSDFQLIKTHARASVVSLTWPGPARVIANNI
jgi:hypothetical protein